MLMARLVASLSISEFVLLREVRGEYMGVKQAYLGRSMKFILQVIIIIRKDFIHLHHTHFTFAWQSPRNFSF